MSSSQVMQRMDKDPLVLEKEDVQANISLPLLIKSCNTLKMLKKAQIEEIVNAEPSLSSIEIVEKCFGPQNHRHVVAFGGGVKAKYLKGGTSTKAPNNPVGVANADQDRGANNQVGGANALASNEQNVDQVVPASKLPTVWTIYFGVAKVVKAAIKGGVESMTVIAGSYGYIAPEYAYKLHVNEKSDIYSFGVFILELVTGKRPVGPKFGKKDLATRSGDNAPRISSL
ncbi:hypothetical protein FXO37_06718 [Capsicum annuum]|nr:hypothetical protein FXO37_06718 [Capsicum annuum]